MRIQLSWLANYVNLPSKLSDLTDALTSAGHMLDKKESVDGDTVIDLELRGNRADCYSILGIAREVSALFATPIRLPNLYKKLSTTRQLTEVSLHIHSPFVRRAMLTAIKNVRIVTSPDWLKKPLLAYGIDSVNNIVDLTNFVMVETGEPLHAFDLDKIGTNLAIRIARQDEKMLTFRGKTVNLDKNDLVWVNKTDVLSIAGSIGEKNHSISDSTKNVLLEGANYDRVNIRRTIHRHNLMTEASIRHEKELDPGLVEEGIYRFLYLVDKYDWGQLTAQVADYYPSPVKPWSISLSFDYLNTLGGVNPGPNKVKTILKGLNFKIKNETKNGLVVICPPYRTDVTLEEDLIEEVLRIDGYDKIPTRTLSLEIPPIVTPAYVGQEENFRTAAQSVGLDETITSSFVSEKYHKFNQYLENANVAPIKIVNRPSPDNEVLRLTLLPNLVAMTQKVINERGHQAGFFEIGKVYFKQKDYCEKRKIGIIYWQKDSEPFTKFKGLVESLLLKANIEKVSFGRQNINNPRLTNTYNLLLDKTVIGFGGQNGTIFYCEIDLDVLVGKHQKTVAQLWPKFPPQIEDITLTIPANVSVGEIVTSIKQTKYVTATELIDTFENYYTFRLWYQDPSKTLTAKEVGESRKSLLSLIKQKFKAKIK